MSCRTGAWRALVAPSLRSSSKSRAMPISAAMLRVTRLQAARQRKEETDGVAGPAVPYQGRASLSRHVRPGPRRASRRARSFRLRLTDEGHRGLRPAWPAAPAHRGVETYRPPLASDRHVSLL